MINYYIITRMYEPEETVHYVNVNGVSLGRFCNNTILFDSINGAVEYMEHHKTRLVASGYGPWEIRCIVR
jgi:hypothetical protein